MAGTSLSTFNVAGNAVKSCVVDLEISRKLFYPNMIKAHCIKVATDLIHAPALNEEVYIQYTDSIGAYTIFDGEIIKISVTGKMYEIIATTRLSRLFDSLVTHNWTGSTAHHAIMNDIANTYGPGITVSNSVSYTTNLTNYNVKNQPAIDQLRKLCYYGANDAGDKFTVFRSSNTAMNTIVLEDYGETAPASAITLSHANGSLVSHLNFSDTTGDIINVVQCAHRGNVHTSADGDTGGFNTSSSRTANGSRTKKLYRPEIDNNTDAIATETTYMRAFSGHITRFSVDVKNVSLHGNATHYSVLNTLYGC